MFHIRCISIHKRLYFIIIVIIIIIIIIIIIASLCHNFIWVNIVVVTLINYYAFFIAWRVKKFVFYHQPPSPPRPHMVLTVSLFGF
jgi:hypothetical protein